MPSLPEQLSAASTRQISAQLDAQFRFCSTFATQALDSASRLASLNLSASRDALERSSRTARQLVQATQPRDLLVLRTHAEEQVRSLFNYSRELFNLTAQPHALRAMSPAALPAALAAPLMKDTVAAADDVAQQSAAAFAETADTMAESVTETADTVSEAVAEAADTHSETIAKAAGKVSEAAADTADTASEAVAETASTVFTAAADTAGTAAEAIDAAPRVDGPAPDGQVIAAAAEALAPAPVVLQQPEVGDAVVRIEQDAEPMARQKQIAKAAGKGAPKAALAPQPLAAPVEVKDTASVTRIQPTSKRRK